MKNIPIRQIKSAAHFSIRTIQDLLAGKDLVHDLHRHNFFFVLALQEGEGVHEIDFTPYTVAANAIFILRPGQVHRLELKAGSTGYLMEFNDEFYHPNNKESALRFRKTSKKTLCLPDVERFKILSSALSYILKEYTGKQDGSNDIIKANLDIFFIELLRQSGQPANLSSNNSAYAQERLEEFLSLLEKHIVAYKQVAHYADLMNISSWQLNEVTKGTLGKTTSAVINEHIILEAKRWLLATSNQVKDIADLLGYEDSSYFIRFFRKQTGISPDSFRRKPA